MKDKFTPDAFRSWVEWTRQRLPAEGDIPEILGDEWTNIREKQPPPWFDSIWSNYEDFDSRHDPDILKSIANESVLNPDDLACRFTALRYLYELSHFDYANCSLIRADAEFASTQKGFLSDFVIMVGLVKPDEVRDWRRIRWEILNAYAIRDWDCALELYNQAEHLRLIELAELHALRGQFRFLQAFSKESLSSLMWEPKLYSEETDPAFAVILLLWGCCHRNDYPSQDTLDLDLVREASYDLERAISKKTDLPLLYRSLLAGCYFALSEFQKAAANYELLGSKNEEFEALVFKGALQSAALSYSRGGDTHRAIAAYERLLERFPNEKGIYLRIAELHTRTIPPDPAACCEALRKEKEMDCNPAADDWQLSTILMLGETGKQSDAAEKQIKQLYRSDPGFQQSERLTKGLLKVYWPSFDCLTENAKEEWVFGETLMQSAAAQPSSVHL